MLEILSDGQLAALAGLGGGVLLGLAARIGRFCTLGAIEDCLYGGSSRRLRMWALAVALAVIGSFALMAAGLLDASQSLYLRFAWNPLASVAGGLMFGYGMALAGNCGYGALARAGGGDLRAFVIVLITGVSAYMAISGPLAQLRVWLFPVEAVDGPLPGFAHLIAGATGVPPALAGISIGMSGVIAVLASREFRADFSAIFWSFVVAVAIVSGWGLTQLIAKTGFDAEPVVSHTFSAPLGETLIYAMTSTGSSIDFGTGSVAGVVIGSIIGSFFMGHFRWEACEDPRELRRQMFGAFLMGTGAVVALGCSVGQGISAFSMLAFSAPVAFAAIFAGAAFGLRQLIYGGTGGTLPT